jgi:hypothetical protein
MGGLYMPRTVAAVLIGVGATGMEVPAQAGDIVGFVPQHAGSQIMLYVSRPIGAARGAVATTFGIRYERTRLASTDPAAQFFAPLRHRSIVELQLARGSTPRLQFGPKVTWDLGRRQLGPTSLATAVWPMAIQPLTDAVPAAWAPSGPNRQ